MTISRPRRRRVAAASAAGASTTPIIRASRVADRRRWDRVNHRRFSFCCDACRKRLTPVSVRFLGRKVYLGVVVLLATVLRHGPTPMRVARLRDHLGVSRDTLARWHHWWRDAFVRTAFWKAARARFALAIAEGDLPGCLLERFTGDGRTRVEAVLRFLGPLTTTAASTLAAARG